MNTHNIPFSIKKRKITLNYPKSADKGFFLGTQERVRNSRGKRAISVRAIEVLLYLQFLLSNRIQNLSLTSTVISNCLNACDVILAPGNELP